LPFEYISKYRAMTGARQYEESEDCAIVRAMPARVYSTIH
jgi:hypothetical protein